MKPFINFLPFLAGKCVLGQTEQRDELYNPIEIRTDSVYDQHKCIKMNATLPLCYQMANGYSHMWLPNFMKHETMGNVTQCMIKGS